ncbi:hypothetical protein IAE16_03210 [Hydrogenobacter sp. T-2]|uniref:hypothetical protein n=1 Tax=Pampinifervens diazotrophicum TaxID=1632018 RepID=UPI002B260B3F|nr:hypothetical protein [Hydrogenobacter sp. T-2]WPM32696.1 hypothetical protein IAE16_03210 [Hydrogenobacter sp. T-2]
MKLVARSVSIEVLGEIERCHDGENSKFYCLPVKIHFDNGEVKEYMLRAHGEPKTLKDFLENKKGLRDKMEKAFGLTEDGNIIYVGYLEESSDS